jgi:sRNA-binding carbon storage regulator CsrA
MLVLMQRPGDKVFIQNPDGTLSTATVLGIVGNKIRMGYEAPTNYVIDREKVYRRKLREARGEAEGNV